MRKLFLPLAIALLPVACSPSTDGVGPRTIVEAIVDQQIIPDHKAFADAARQQQTAVSALCATPGDATLTTAREAFRKTALAWSRIEWLSFGPARQGNRREILFFWPDNRGRGQRQVEELATSTDAAQFADAAFTNKSVSVKGLPALEYVLFGEGADALLSPGAVRCAFANAIAASVATTAQDLSNAWQGDKGYRQVILSAGPENAEFRNHKEALQKFLTAASEQVQIVKDLKLKPLLAERNGAFVPIAPPFSAAGIPFAAMSQNVDGASSVFLNHASKLLPEESAYRAESLRFEVEAIQRTLGELGALALPAAQLAQEKLTRDRLAYLALPLEGAHALMSEVYPAALGLVMGFNSLDGD